MPRSGQGRECCGSNACPLQPQAGCGRRTHHPVPSSTQCTHRPEPSSARSIPSPWALQRPAHLQRRQRSGAGALRRRRPQRAGEHAHHLAVAQRRLQGEATRTSATAAAASVSFTLAMRFGGSAGNAARSECPGSPSPPCRWHLQPLAALPPAPARPRPCCPPAAPGSDPPRPGHPRCRGTSAG